MDNLIIREIVSQHAEDAAFLWLLRDRAVCAPHYSLKDVSKLDDRLEAHIDGLRIAGDVGWEVCTEALEIGEPGEVFAAAVLAFERSDERMIEEVLNTGEKSYELSRGVVSAFGWLPYEHAQPYIQGLLDSGSSYLRRIGIAASAVHRKDIGKYIADAISSDDPLLKARALKAAGEFGRRDLSPVITSLVNEESERCRFWAAWSATILGDVNAIFALKSLTSQVSPYREEALRVALRRMDLSDAHVWERELAQDSDTLRLALIGAGVVGDPTSVPWLVECMKSPPFARIAGESFTMITGVDIAFEDLDGEKPEGFEAGPNEHPEDENVAMDPDEDLPWPNPELISGWWNKNKAKFINGTRYLLGQPITAENLQNFLRTGRQRQRYASALELSIMKPGQPLFEVRAPGFRQMRILGLK